MAIGMGIASKQRSNNPNREVGGSELVELVAREVPVSFAPIVGRKAVQRLDGIQVALNFSSEHWRGKRARELYPVPILPSSQTINSVHLVRVGLGRHGCPPLITGV